MNTPLQPNKLKLPLLVFVFVSFILAMIQIKVEMKMLLLERLFKNGGWIEIIMVALYGMLIAWFMQDVKRAPKWRIISWTVFSICFFLQLILGIVVSDTFLLTGKLHLPVPAMIIAGPLYRQQLSVMTILFLSTIILSGPAWCSHLCYFGAIDGQFSKHGHPKPKRIHKRRLAIKGTIMAIVIFTALTLLWLDISPAIATLIGLLFGITGLGLIIFFSGKHGKMIHCVMYCPIGTLVNYLRFINPFRIYIDDNCTTCMACSSVCRYDALNFVDIQKKKPGLTCTLCGDCLKSCHAESLKYKLFRLSPEAARKTYLFITISIHATFMAMGRI